MHSLESALILSLVLLLLFSSVIWIPRLMLALDGDGRLALAVSAVNVQPETLLGERSVAAPRAYLGHRESGLARTANPRRMVEAVDLAKDIVHYRTRLSRPVEALPSELFHPDLSLPSGPSCPALPSASSYPALPSGPVYPVLPSTPVYPELPAGASEEE